MKVTKIASFNEEDENILIAAGEFLGQIKNAILNKEIDQLDSKASSLVSAIADVARHINDMLQPVSPVQDIKEA